MMQALEEYPRLKQFVSLTRFDRPIGSLLLLWPTLWALWLAAEGWPGWHLFLVFTLGTFLARSAGCIVNDLADMRFDGSVERTKNRPLVTGEVKRWEAVLLAMALLVLCLLLVLTTNLFTVKLAVGAVLVTVIYPLMKRYTYLPQVVLGVAFSMGILMAFTAVNNELDKIAWLLLLANLLWTVAYDTEYAMVDRDDDIRIGIKSTAILFADLDRPMIALLQMSALATFMLVPRSVELSDWYHYGLAAAACLFLYQHWLIRKRSREGCFAAFLNNHWVGFCIFASILSHYIITGG